MHTRQPYTWHTNKHPTSKRRINVFSALKRKTIIERRTCSSIGGVDQTASQSTIQYLTSNSNPNILQLYTNDTRRMSHNAKRHVNRGFGYRLDQLVLRRLRSTCQIMYQWGRHTQAGLYTCCLQSNDDHNYIIVVNVRTISQMELDLELFLAFLLCANKSRPI